MAIQAAIHEATHKAIHAAICAAFRRHTVHWRRTVHVLRGGALGTAWGRVEGRNTTQHNTTRPSFPRNFCNRFASSLRGRAGKDLPRIFVSILTASGVTASSLRGNEPVWGKTIHCKEPIFPNSVHCNEPFSQTSVHCNDPTLETRFIAGHGS